MANVSPRFKRDHMVTIRLTRDEQRQLLASAKKADVRSVSDYIRTVVLTNSEKGTGKQVQQVQQ